ncbi:MAG: hypothetical protein J7L57_05045 [Deltaproteobacteria bacterium]|nr:hypothetical protein [Candidatus Tharpella sp.]
MTCKIFYLAICLAWLAASVLTPTNLWATENPHKMLFENKCSKCHNPDRIKKFHKDKKKMSDTVKRMSGKRGSNITQEELDAIDEYILSLDFDTGSG